MTRVAATQIAKRAPSWGKHAGAAGAVGTFLAAWFFANRIKMLEKYHTPIVVGSAIAALQSLIQLYIPSLGWMICDATPELAASSAAADQAVVAAQATAHLLPTNDDPNEFVYNDSFDAGRYGRQPMPSQAGTGPGGPAQGAQGPIDMSDLAIEDAVGQANLGVFAGN